MTNQPEIQKLTKPATLREDIRVHLKGLGCPEPHLILASLAAGVDPRAIPDSLGQLIRQCHEKRQNGSPRPEDWEKLYDYYQRHPEIGAGCVDVDTSLTATIKLMPHLHPKLKSLEVSGDLEHKVRVRPLTDEDIQKLEAKLKGEI
jgi:hypothetical protein